MRNGFLVEGVKYEFPYSYPHAVIQIVEEAIRYAWKLLKENPPDNFDLSKALEDNITAELQEKIEELRVNGNIIAGFDSKEFETVNRGTHCKNYNGRSINKQPDLIFRLRTLHPGVSSLEYGIFIECKPIDIKHSIGENYCKKGIKRFIAGDYAWAMRQSIMLGYVKGNYSVIPNLYDILNKNLKTYNTKKLPYPCQYQKTEKSKKEAVYITRHGRDWTYLGTDDKASDIDIRHLWLASV